MGSGKLDGAGPGEYRNNFTVDGDEFEFAAREDYRPNRKSTLLAKAVDAGNANGQALMPEQEYVHPRQAVPLKRPARHPGALQK